MVLTVALVACAPDATTGTTSAPGATSGGEGTSTPTTEPSSSSSTEHTSHSTDTSSPSPSEPVDQTDRPAELSLAELPAGAACAVGSVPDGGQTTFVVGGKLWGLDQRGAVSCLADLQGRNPTWIAWSPDGDEVLVGPDVVLRNNGSFVPTGYFADNRGLRWSAPTGKALLAPNASTGHLIWRDAHDSGDRIDVSFTERTTAAAYHPAGKHIAAAGIGNDGAGEGVFIATNRGRDAQRIGQIESGEVADLTFEMNGDSIAFLHRHLDGLTEVHRYSFSTGALEVIATVPGEQVDHLFASPVDQGSLAWSTTHSTQSSVVWVQREPFGAPVSVSFTESVVTPLSWLPNHQLLVARSTPPAADGAPFDVWSWADGTVRHLVDGVTAAAARTVHGPYLELNIIQGSGFG